MEMQVNEVLTHSHSIVDGGFELMSYTTRLIPLYLVDDTRRIVARSSCGNRAQSAVIHHDFRRRAQQRCSRRCVRRPSLQHFGWAGARRRTARFSR